MTSHNSRPLVGQRVRIVRTAVTGKVLDVSNNRGGEILIEGGGLMGGDEWYPAASAIILEEHDADLDADQAHVDAIEQRLKQGRLASLAPTYDTERALVALIGAASVTRRVAFVPSVRS